MTSLRSLALLALLVPALPSASGCSSSSEPAAQQVSAAEAYELLISTPWLDHMPASEADKLHILVFDRSGNGAYVNGSLYRGSYDQFSFEEEGDKLELTFLQDGAKAKARYRIERMSRNGFDLRLTFSSSPRGPKSYYGFNNSRAVPAAVQARAAAAVRATRNVTP